MQVLSAFGLALRAGWEQARSLGLPISGISTRGQRGSRTHKLYREITADYSGGDRKFPSALQRWRTPTASTHFSSRWLWMHPN